MKTTGERELSRLVEDPDLVADADADRWAVDLLRAAAPYRPPAGRKQRVRLSLGQSASRRAPLVLRLAIVAGVLIGCGAFASAAFGHWRGWMARVYERWVPPAQVAAAPQPNARAHERRPQQASPAPVGAPADEIASPETTTALAPSPTIVPSESREAIPAPPHARRAPSPAAGEDTSVVLEAMRALRLERNPVRARVLLAKYLDRHPTGTLAEEALAMSIEAAVAHHDADAAALGARYLTLYPTGPFHALARQTQR
jgi:hypothetical protein